MNTNIDINDSGRLNIFIRHQAAAQPHKTEKKKKETEATKHTKTHTRS